LAPHRRGAAAREAMIDSMRTALVTGANRGLGLEAGRQLAEGGFRVVLTSRSDDGARVAAQLGSPGLAGRGLLLHVTDGVSLTRLHDELAGASIDVLVNNAGIALQGFNADVARRTLDVNFFGAMRVTDGLLDRIPEGGNIVMVSSGLGEVSALSPALRA